LIDLKEQAAKEINQDEEKVDTDELKAKFGRADSSAFFASNPFVLPCKPPGESPVKAKDVN